MSSPPRWFLMATDSEHIHDDYDLAVDHDGWYSLLISFSVHLVMLLTLWVLSLVVVKDERGAPPIQIVEVARADTSPGPEADMLPPGDSPVASTDAAPAESPLADAPTTSVQEATTAIDTKVDLEQATDALREQAARQRDEARRAAAAAKAAVAGKMRENLGSGTSGGGAGGGGRVPRAARWVLQFNTSNAGDYLAQLGGLEAEVAFPQKGDNYLYFSNLATTPKSSVRDLAGESRIYWMDERPESFGPVARELGVGPTALMVAFLPQELEEKMVKMELSYRGASSEDDILQTVFKCVRRGGAYDVIIVSQRLRNE